MVSMPKRIGKSSTTSALACSDCRQPLDAAHDARVVGEAQTVEEDASELRLDRADREIAAVAAGIGAVETCAAVEKPAFWEEACFCQPRQRARSRRRCIRPPWPG